MEGARGSIFDHRGRHPDDPIGCVIERGQGLGGRDPHGRSRRARRAMRRGADRVSVGLQRRGSGRRSRRRAAPWRNKNRARRARSDAAVETMGVPARGRAAGSTTWLRAPRDCGEVFGRRPWSVAALSSSVVVPFPPPPRCAWSPSPASAGEDKPRRTPSTTIACANADRARHPHPRSGGGGPGEAWWRGRGARPTRASLDASISARSEQDAIVDRVEDAGRVLELRRDPWHERRQRLNPGAYGNGSRAEQPGAGGSASSTQSVTDGPASSLTVYSWPQRRRRLCPLGGTPGAERNRNRLDNGDRRWRGDRLLAMPMAARAAAAPAQALAPRRLGRPRRRSRRGQAAPSLPRAMRPAARAEIQKQRRTAAPAAARRQAARRPRAMATRPPPTRLRPAAAATARARAIPAARGDGHQCDRYRHVRTPATAIAQVSAAGGSGGTGYSGANGGAARRPASATCRPARPPAICNSTNMPMAEPAAADAIRRAGNRRRRRLGVVDAVGDRRRSVVPDCLQLRRPAAAAAMCKPEELRARAAMP